LITPQLVCVINTAVGRSFGALRQPQGDKKRARFRLEFGAWSFFGAWMLKFGASSRRLEAFRDSTGRTASGQINGNLRALMRQIPKTDLSPTNGCIIDTKWKLGTLGYHPHAATNEAPKGEITRLPELVVYDHIGFGGAYARTNLSFHFIGDFWNDRISSLIVVSGIWRFYRDEYYKGDHWDLGPGYYESFFTEKGPDDVVSSFQAIALT
jgi:hypothetical protein